VTDDPDTTSLMAPIKVLVVEDSADDAELMLQALKTGGLAVLPRRAETEFEYLQALRESPDVVLCDHVLPTFDAPRALKILRDRGMDTPFIVVSGRIGEAVAVELAKAGANDYVHKDELVKLATTVRRALKEGKRRRRARQLAAKQQRLDGGHDSLLKGLPGMAYRLRHESGSWHFDFVSEGCKELTGYGQDTLTGDEGLEFSRFIYGDLKEPLYADLQHTLERDGHFSLEHRIRCADGSVKWVWHRGAAVLDRDGKPMYVEGFLADETAQRMDQAKLDYLAHHDVLTGLANRAVFDEQLAGILERADRRSRKVTLLFMDLDRFKEINDSLGHQAGDAVLRCVAARLAAASRKGDIVARLGGDEFALVMEDSEKAEDVAQFVSRLLKEIARPMKVLDWTIEVMASVGIAVHPTDGKTAMALIKNADAAMYAAKKGGGDTFRFFTVKMNERARSMAAMREALQKAVREGEFEPHYQPEVRLSDRRITSVEALARWRRAEGKLMTAEQFISFAAEAGLAASIDGWMLQSACKRAAEWGEEGVPYGRIAVNVSAHSLADPKLARELESYMKEYGVHPDWLEVEVTEAAIMQNSVGAQATLEKIADLGIALTLDDFGRGDASLKNLRRHPIKRLKIDREFVKGLPWRDEDVQFCRAVLAAAENLHIEVVAEGVEKQEQEMFLLHAGCHGALGNLYSPPLSMLECARLLGDGGSMPDPDKTRPDLVRPDISKLMDKSRRT